MKTTRDAAGQRALPSYPVRFLHLTAVWAFSVSQPLMALVNGNPELLIENNATRLDVLVVVIGVAVVPPLVATGYAWIAGRLSAWAGDLVYLFLLGLFLAPFVLQLEKVIEPGAAVAILGGLAVCALATIVYARWHAARLFVGFSIALPVLGLIAFTASLPPLSGEASAASSGPVRTSQPIVWLVLDELAMSSLLTTAGDVDAGRYPNFARLAREGTWYPNATTVQDSTQAALPAILTGNSKRQGNLPITHHYPNNVFTLLGESYDLSVNEATSRLCPASLCPQYDRSFRQRVSGVLKSIRFPLVYRVLPESLSPTFRDVDFERVQGGKMNEALAGFDSFVAGMRRGTAASLDFAHVLVPHSPWRYFPSGVEYNFDGRDGLIQRERWDDDPWPSLEAQQQYLLQLGFADALVGRMLERLDRLGSYRSALVIVMADHGVAFRPGASHRWVSQKNRENLYDIASIPLFVKYPNQTRGRIDRRLARNVDVVPTIADLLDVPIPWKHDGRSLLGPARQGDTVVVTSRSGERVTGSVDAMVASRAAVVSRKVRYFGQGASSPFLRGRNQHLVGALVNSKHASERVRVRIENAAALVDVDVKSGFVPALVSGVVERERLPRSAELAIAINGRVRALTRPFSWANRQIFTALVPEGSFRSGFNRVDVYLVDENTREARLVRLGSNAPSS